VNQTQRGVAGYGIPAQERITACVARNVDRDQARLFRTTAEPYDLSCPAILAIHDAATAYSASHLFHNNLLTATVIGGGIRLFAASINSSATVEW
jgi:hypothetical protein